MQTEAIQAAIASAAELARERVLAPPAEDAAMRFNVDET
jgi:hypothetical protein